MKPLISVVVPVFNVEKYLPRCIESIIRQSYKDLEILLVDDGSSDGSGRICDQYGKIDKRIKVIHKKNGGLSDARNVGIDLARGNYIGFVDSDDYIHEDMYLSLYDTIRLNGCDIAEVGYQTFFHDDDIKDPDDYSRVILYTKQQAVIGAIVNHQCQTYVWNKLYKKELWNKVRFPKGKLFEDEFTTYKIFNRSAKVAVLNKKMYYYFQREKSIAHTFSIKTLDHCEALNQMMRFIESEYPEALPISCIKYYKNNLWHLQDLLVNRKKLANSQQLIDQMIKELMTYRQYLENNKKFIGTVHKLFMNDYSELLTQRKKIKFVFFLLKRSVWLFYIILRCRWMARRMIALPRKMLRS
ncbi:MULTISPECIES: glycosyltransferase family 2 protein [unclassified Sporolactobacillus]|uniref:glycosyltransferase family 2 protein n=1 Tax=unclassified Sporolactobacillus TaxID=2628533 RepID=UPI0023685972|nr:glycosyltransferase family 2 protein [Sporolactobacillus sp. CQH2019]MDD9148995.1 glycosyltransferase [Sporolactobacillus sp. CQH2019]